MKINLLLVALLICTSTQTVSADLFDIEWELKRDKDAIQIYTGDVAGSKFKAVKAIMELDTTLAELVALVRDAKACSDWADLCKKAEHVEILSATEMFVYTLNDLPWPVSDRDAVAHIVWSQDPSTHSVTMRATVTSDKLPKRKGVVRLTYGVTSWTFTPLADGKVSVLSHAHVDPAGATPAWLTNRLLVDSPYVTLDNMRTITNSKKYAGATFDFLTEPALHATTQ